MLQFTSPVSQIISSQTSTGKKFLPSASVTGAAQQDPESDFEQQTNLTSPVHPLEEEGEFLTKRLVYCHRNLDQHPSEEQNYQETDRGPVIHGVASGTGI